MTEHVTLTGAFNHPITGFLAYANASARITAGATLDSTNVDKVAFQTDTGTYWAFLGAGLWRLVSANRPVVTDSTTARTFGMSDQEAYFRFTNGASITGTIPPSSSVAFPVGTILECLQAGAGQFALAAGAGVTFGPGTLFGTSAQGKKISARKIATDTWDITGDTAAIGGGGGGGGGGGTPLTLITSVPVKAWLRADMGVTIATGVSNWVDQSTNAFSFAQATGANQPTRTLTDATLNNMPTITGNGTSQSLNAASIVTTAAYWLLVVMKQISWTLGGRLTDSPGSTGYTRILQDPGAPSLALFGSSGHESSGNSNAALGAWKRVTAQENNTTSDGILVGATPVTGTALGRSGTQNQLTLFSAWGGGAAFFNGAIAELIITDGIPTSGEKTAIDSYLSSRYALASLFT